MSTSALLLLIALAIPQNTPSTGAIAKYVPPAPTPASFISDQRRVLTDSQHASLDARIAAVQRDGLGDIGVAILPSIGDYSPAQVGVEIYRTWRIGQRADYGSEQRNLGVLLLIVVKELSPNNRGECWITTGLGAEGRMTDGAAAAICRNSIVPQLRNRNHAAGIAAGITSIEYTLRGGAAFSAAPAPAPVAPRRTNDVRPGWNLPWFAIVLGAGLTAILALVGITRRRRNRPRECPRCGRMMQRLDEQVDDAKLDSGQLLEEKLRSVDYDVWICGCGESMVIPYRRIFSKYSKCRECNRRTASSSYHIITPATAASTGYAENRFHCQACQAKWVESIVLPRIVHTSSSSGGHHGGGGDGGGGHSFGGSGHSSGGGGGSSY